MFGYNAAHVFSTFVFIFVFLRPAGVTLPFVPNAGNIF